jgi:type I restriction enzyme R subunit
LAYHTTYKSYYEIEKSIEDNPLFDTNKAQKKTKGFCRADKQTIAIKADIIVDHFISQLVIQKAEGKSESNSSNSK